MRICLIGGDPLKSENSIIPHLEAAGAQIVANLSSEDKVSIPANTQAVLCLSDVQDHSQWYAAKKEAKRMGVTFCFVPRKWGLAKPLLETCGLLNTFGRFPDMPSTHKEPRTKKAKWPLSLALWCWEAEKAGMKPGEMRRKIPSKYVVSSGALQMQLSHLRTMTKNSEEPMLVLTKHYHMDDIDEPAMPSFYDAYPQPQVGVEKVSEPVQVSVRTFALTDMAPLIQMLREAVTSKDDEMVELRLTFTSRQLKDLLLFTLEKALK